MVSCSAEDGYHGKASVLGCSKKDNRDSMQIDRGRARMVTLVFFFLFLNIETLSLISWRILTTWYHRNTRMIYLETSGRYVCLQRLWNITIFCYTCHSIRRCCNLTLPGEDSIDISPHQPIDFPQFHQIIAVENPSASFSRDDTGHQFSGRPGQEHFLGPPYWTVLRIPHGDPHGSTWCHNLCGPCWSCGPMVPSSHHSEIFVDDFSMGTWHDWNKDWWKWWSAMMELWIFFCGAISICSWF